MIDFHNHLVPGADDGAADLDQARRAFVTLREQGVHTIVTTPHLKGSITGSADHLASRFAEIDAPWEELRALVASEFPGLRLERGAEVMLDTLTPDLSDPRTRLAGTRFALVEFPHMAVPPNPDQPLFHLKQQGWTPVLAHPERYAGLGAQLHEVAHWRSMGTRLQVNAGSILGRYGSGAQAIAWELLARGWISYLSSDHHARGRVALADARAALLAQGGSRQAELLFETNPALLLAGEAPEAVPPLQKHRPFWKRILGRRG